MINQLEMKKGFFKIAAGFAIVLMMGSCNRVELNRLNTVSGSESNQLNNGNYNFIPKLKIKEKELKAKSEKIMDDWINGIESRNEKY